MVNASTSNKESLFQSRIDKKVLIIDDSWGDLLLMKEALYEVGYKEIYYATKGVEGIRKAISLKPNLIILDLHLPDINGILAYRVIKAGQTNNTKFIIISGVKNSHLLETFGQMKYEGDIPDVFIEKSHDYVSLQKMVNRIAQYDLSDK